MDWPDLLQEQIQLSREEWKALVNKEILSVKVRAAKLASTLPSSPSTSGLAQRLHPQAPSHLMHLLDEFDQGVNLDAPATSLRALRATFAFLLGFCADLLGAACVDLGANAELFLLASGEGFRASEAENRIKECCYFLSQREEPLAKRLTRIFFLENGEPTQHYLLSQGGKVQGKLGGLDRLSDFCKEPRRAPGRGDSFRTRNAYLPHLETWISNLNHFWTYSERLWERTALDGSVQLAYLAEGHTLTAGARLELQSCRACIPCRLLTAPAEWVKGENSLGIPQEVPEHCLHLVDRLVAALDAQDVIESTRLLRDFLEFLMRYFAGVGKMLCESLDCLSEAASTLSRNTESVDNCELLLQHCVESLKSALDDPAARAFVGVFFRRDQNLNLQPRSHTNLLLLEGVLSSWFKQERGKQPEAGRYKVDFGRYYPICQDWVQSMGPYFSLTEHFSDEPSEHGQLPLTARCGEHLLELIEEHYCLRIRQCPICLPNPIWLKQTNAATTTVEPKLNAEQILRKANLTAEAKPIEATVSSEPIAPAPVVRERFPGEFRPLELPSDAPKFLYRLLKRLDIHVRRGELCESRSALQDCLAYLVRYWSGVAWTTAHRNGTTNSEQDKMASQSLNIQECERLLNSTIVKLVTDNSELGTEVLQVFFTADLFTDELKPVGSHTRMLQTDSNQANSLALLADFCESSGDGTVHQARRDLKTFLPVLRDWTKHSQTFFEQCIHHEEEPDKNGQMELIVQFDETFLELVAPDFTFFVKPGSDSVPDLEVPEWKEPEAVTPETVEAKPRSITSEELALMEPFLIHKVQYVGIQTNSQGKQCKSGIISIQNAGGGSLTGRAFSNHPCIEVSPNRFRDKSQLTYWLDESTIPVDFVPVLVLRSGGDERQVSLAELRPLSRMNTVSKSQAITLLWLPTVFGALGLNLLIAVQAKKIQTATVSLRGSLRELAPEVLNECQGFGSYIGGFYLLYAGLTAVVTLHIYRRFSHSIQDLIAKSLLPSLAAPTAIALLTTIINSFFFPGVRHPEITHAYLFRLTPWGIFFALGAAVYAYLENEHKVEEWIQEPALRRAARVSLAGFFLFLWSLALN